MSEIHYNPQHDTKTIFYLQGVPGNLIYILENHFTFKRYITPESLKNSLRSLLQINNVSSLRGLYATTSCCTEFSFNMMMMSLSMVFSLLHTPTAIVTFQCGLHFEVLSTKRSVIKLRFGCSPLKKSIFERQVLVGKEKLLSSGNQLLRVRVDSYSKINPRFSLDMKTFKGIKGKQSRLIIRVGGLDSVFFLLCVDLLIHALPLNAILPT